MADNFRLPATPSGDPGTGPLVRSVDDGTAQQQVFRIGGGYSPLVESGNLSAAQPLPGTVVAGGTVGGATDISSAGNVQITVKGTYIGALMFEASDDGGTTWYPQSAVREDTQKPEFLTPTLTNFVGSWQVDLAGFNRFRVRMPTRTSGTAVVMIDYGSHPYTPVVAAVFQAPPGAVETRFVYAGAGATTETIASVQAYRAGATSGAAATSQAITAGKTFRLMYLSVMVRATAATAGGGAGTLRYNASGAAVVGSPIIAASGGSVAAAIGASDANSIDFGPAGLEFVGGQFGLTYIATPATVQFVIVAGGIEY